MANLKTFRVCLSSELPPLEERDPNFVYFLYDKLVVFIGQNLYSDPYAIVEKMPNNPIGGMLYFVMDGYIRAYINYSIMDLAIIENQEQLELLKQSGTTFFVNSEKRYLDVSRRTITLPYQNGTYELTVSIANNLIIDKNTVIGFNPETNQFEIIGKRDDYDLVFTKGYRGSKSKTTNIDVTDHKISAEVKISAAYDNIIKVLEDGLYVNADGKVSKVEFQSWVENFRDYKSNMELYLRDLRNQIDKNHTSVSQESIANKIKTAIEEIYPEINKIMDSYEYIAANFDGIEERVKKYTDVSVNTARNDIIEAIREATEDPWGDF